MSRGGTRPGAGRKTGSTNRVTQDARAQALNSGEMPLDYMLRIMRDENADQDRRDDMAKTCAPYLHPKIASFSPGGDGENALSTLLTGMRQSLAAKLDRIALGKRAPEPSDESDR